MSRVGRAPVFFDKAVQVTITPKNEVVVKGAKHTMTVLMRPEIKAKIEDGKVMLTPSSTEPRIRAFHGLYRALIQNAVTGVSKGWTRELELNGVGYRASVSGISWNSLWVTATRSSIKSRKGSRSPSTSKQKS